MNKSIVLSNQYVAKNNTITLTPTKTSSSYTLSWSTSSTSGASISATSGNSITVTGKVTGTYTIKAVESTTGKTTAYTIQVTSLTAGGNVTVLEDNTVTLTEATKSSNAGTVTYKLTAGSSYASFNTSTRVVTGVEAGANPKTATVTATESNGGATCTYTVTVKVWNGSGTSSDPYQITNLRDIQKLSTKSNRTVTADDDYTYSSKYFKQTANINLGGSTNGSWTPIGKDATRFSATYDGGSKTITGLYISHPAEEYYDQGLFGNTSENTTIKNFTISNASVTTISQNSGICVGYNRGTVESVKVIGGTLSVGRNAGGIAGNNAGGTITLCSNSSTVNYTSTVTSTVGTLQGWSMGGIIGSNTGTIQKCINTGNITGTHSVGGIAGSIWSGTVQECVNKGPINAETDPHGQGSDAGGITAAAGGGASGTQTIKNCYNIGTLTGMNINYQGGIVQQITTSISTYSFSDNYYLSTCGSNTQCWDNGVGLKTMSGITSKTATQLKALTSTLGSAYKADSTTSPVNSGYPILSWQ